MPFDKKFGCWRLCRSATPLCNPTFWLPSASLNERAFKELVAVRKGSLMAMQKVSEAIHRVLADTTVIDLSEAAVEDLKQELVEAEKHNKYFRRRIRVHHHIYEATKALTSEFLAWRISVRVAPK